MQRFQFCRGLTLFRQTCMRKQRPGVMGNPAQQIAIIRSIGLAVQWLPQHNERREPPQGEDGETERGSRSR